MSRAIEYSRLAVFALMLALAACSSPDPKLYTIGPVSGAPQNAGPKVIVVQQVTTARYLERSQIVRSSENNKLDVLLGDWWGEPLNAMLGRVLVEELGQRMPRSVVLGETGAVTASPDATVEVNVQRLDQDSGTNLILNAVASVNFKGRGSPILRNFRFSIPLPAPGVPGEVSAISTAVGQLADGLAATLAQGR
jgi:uncharacterized lipoprotein YmbA